MNNKSIFNLSIIELLLILFFMFISVSLYQLTYKNNQISELSDTVKSERKIMQEIVQKNYPQLENQIDDLVNLEKCKKSNIALRKKNTGIDYLTNKMFEDIKNADTKEYAKKYDELQNEKIRLREQIANLKGNELTINILTELHQQNEPLHKQIITLEQKIKDNYKNRMLLINKINKLKTNQKVKYILSKLGKNDAPIQEQITAINTELQRLNGNRLGKSYNKDTTYILENLQQMNSPLQQQREVLQASLENQNLLREIENLRKQLANNLNTNNRPLNIQNLQNALNNLENIKNNPTESHNPNTTNVLENLGMNNMPINQQVTQLKNTLEREKQLQNQLTNDENLNNENINTANIKKALNNLQDIENKHTNTYTANSKNVLKKLDMDDKILHEQISQLQKKLDLEKQLKEKLANNFKVGNQNLNKAEIEKALENLQKMQNKTLNEYDPKSKDILKNLGVDKKSLLEQINTLKNKLDTDKQLREQLANNLKAKNEDLNTADMKKALDTLQKMQNKTTNEYDPTSKKVLKQLGSQNKPLLEQINDIKNQLEKDKQLKQRQADNLKNQLEQENKLQKQIEKLEKQIDKKALLKDPNITKESIQKALADLDKVKENLSQIKPNKSINSDADKIYKQQLKGALDGIKEIKKIKDKLSNKTNSKPQLNRHIDNAIRYLENKELQPQLKASKDVQATLDKFHIKGKPTAKQLSHLYKNLYSIPSNNINISELNFIINRLNNQRDLNNRLKYINNFLQEDEDTKDAKNSKATQNTQVSNNSKEFQSNQECRDGVDIYTQNEIETLKNQVKYLQKRIEKNGVSYLPCFLDNDGSSIFLFQLSLRDNNIHVELGEHPSVPELSKDLPNIDKLVHQTMSLKKFMKLTKPIFEQSVQDECRQFVYFIDDTVSKKEYKRKTLTIQHHFYKYIDQSW